MGRFSRALVILFMVIGISAAFIPVYSQDKVEQEIVTSVSGEILMVNTEKSTVAIKKNKEDDSGPLESINILISPKTKIQKGRAKLKISDLRGGDKIKAEFVNDAAGNLVVKNVIIEETTEKK